jgi:serine/threonine protein phosphatase PrpC
MQEKPCMELVIRRNTNTLNRAIPKANWNFFRKKPSAEHLALLVPGNPQDRTGVVHTKGKTSVFAHVRKKQDKTKCQDVTIVSTDKEHTLIGVLDGFGDEGDFVPVLMGDEISRLWLERKQQINNCQELSKLLFDAAVLSLRNIDIHSMRGGTTATIAALFPDRRYMIASVGDSAAYLIDPDGKISRLLTHDIIYHSVESVGYFDNIINLKPSPDSYESDRNILVTSICRHLNREDIEITEGVLEQGARLLLVSDGITKNLYSGTDEEGRIMDVSGCVDLEGIIQGRTSIEDIGEAIAEKAHVRAVNRIRRIIPNGKSGGFTLLPADDDMAVVMVERS